MIIGIGLDGTNTCTHMHTRARIRDVARKEGNERISLPRVAIRLFHSPSPS